MKIFATITLVVFFGLLWKFYDKDSKSFVSANDLISIHSKAIGTEMEGTVALAVKAGSLLKREAKMIERRIDAEKDEKKLAEYREARGLTGDKKQNPPT